MPNFKYTDDETRLYPKFGIAVKGRVVATEKDAPDFRWEETTDEVTDPPVPPPFLNHGNQYEFLTATEDETAPADVPPPAAVPPAPAKPAVKTPDPAQPAVPAPPAAAPASDAPATPAA